MLDNSAIPAKSRQRRLLKFNGLSWTRRALKGTGQTPAGPQPMGYNLLQQLAWSPCKWTEVLR